MKILTDIKITEDEISLRIFGQKFTKYINFSPKMTDKDKVYYIGQAFMELGQMIEITAMYGKSEKYPDHRYPPFIEHTIGFDKKGKVIIPK